MIRFYLVPTESPAFAASASLAYLGLAGSGTKAAGDTL